MPFAVSNVCASVCMPLIHRAALFCTFMSIDINSVQLLGRVGANPKKVGDTLGKGFVVFNVATEYTLPSKHGEEHYSGGKWERKDLKRVCWVHHHNL